MTSLPPKPKRSTKRRTLPTSSRRSSDYLSGMDPKFVEAAKASKKRFGPLFKRLAKT